MPMSHGVGIDALVVLVVEDEWFVRRIIADFLHEAGCVVIEAEDGECAIHMCNSGMQIGVLFTDINLKGAADGWEVAEAFREACDDMPVIYASGNPIDRPGAFRAVCGSTSLINCSISSRLASASMTQVPATGGAPSPPASLGSGRSKAPPRSPGGHQREEPPGPGDPLRKECEPPL
jgi:CheY-like chemotaxis protein